jgi:hypothetical protein
VVVVKTRHGALDLMAASHLTRAYADEDFWIADLGLAVLWHYYSP